MPDGTPSAVTRHSRHEADRLSRELLLRMGIQNGTVAASVLATAAFLIAIALGPAAAGPLAVGAILVVGAFVLQWCHSGIRIMQITRYMAATFEPADLGWERWLRANRPRRLLGARWAISTKGVFLGCQIAVLCLALRTGAAEAAMTGVALVGIAASAGLLLTNPRE